LCLRSDTVIDTLIALTYLLTNLLIDSKRSRKAFVSVQAMKQQRVRLMKQLKAESEQFRRTKATMAREMLQLKSQVKIVNVNTSLFSQNCISCTVSVNKVQQSCWLSHRSVVCLLFTWIVSSLSGQVWFSWKLVWMIQGQGATKLKISYGYLHKLCLLGKRDP